MQGIENLNFPAFDDAAKSLREAGWEVFSPAEHKDFNLRSALAADLQWIALYAEAMFMLSGWENSKGAKCEWALAVALDLEIIYQASVGG